MRRLVNRLRRILNEAVVPRSLFWRSILIVVLPLVILQVVLSVIFYNRHWDQVTRWLATGVAGEVALVAELLGEAESPESVSRTLARFREHTDLRISLEPGGELEKAARVVGIEPENLSHIDNKILEAFEAKLDHPYAVDLRSEMPQRVVVYVELPEGLLRVLAERKRVTATTIGVLLAWMIGASLVLILVAVYLLRMQVRPIRQLARAVDSFGKGRDVGDFTPRGPSEIRRAARAFNSMRERILRHIGQRTEMLAAISHDLRTPLTRMKLELELLGDDGLAPGLKADVEEMIAISETYLAFVRGVENETICTTPLKPVLEAMRERGERAGATVELADCDGLSLPVRPLAFRRCLANIVDNAGRHGRWIGLAAEQSGREVVITVEDDGPGIPEELREQVFNPFFRLDHARGRETGGTGLGLTIARDIVLGHGGEIALGRSARGGLKAVLRLPS